MNTQDIEKLLANQYRYGKYFFMTGVKNWQSFWTNDLLILDWVAVLKSRVKPKMIWYEIKVSRGDFLKDKKRVFYQQYVNEFFFVCPEWLIDKKELPDEVWLIYATKDWLKTVKKAKYQGNKPNVNMLRYIIMSKLQNDNTEYRTYRRDIENYIQDKISDTQMGHTLNNKIWKKLVELAYKNSELTTHNEMRLKKLKNIESKMQELVKENIIPRFWFWFDRDWNEIVKAIDGLAKQNKTWVPQQKIETMKSSAEQILKICNSFLSS